jgi:hypothetical protein
MAEFLAQRWKRCSTQKQTFPPTTSGIPLVRLPITPLALPSSAKPEAVIKFL